MAKLDMQQTFDTVARHLLSMKERSFDPARVTCAYRSPGGGKCAIGCLIADEDYSETFEGISVWDGNISNAVRKSVDLSVDTYFLHCLQMTHDMLDNWGGDAMRKCLSDIAKVNGLSAAVLDTVVMKELEMV
jgi:hypothetical protein